MITRIHLTNFKSHEDTVVTFTGGPTGILGKNGAGKTSLLQAVGLCIYNTGSPGAWVRKGCKTGRARVSFLAKDGKEYTVDRRIGQSSVKLLDANGVELASVQNDVYTGVKDLLGLDPNTELPRLYEELVGVPQGDLTVAFRSSAAKRRPIFDSILHVDEYSKAWEALKDVHTLAQDKRHELELAEATLTGRLNGAGDRAKQAGELTKQVADETTQQGLLTKQANDAAAAFEAIRAKERVASDLLLKSKEATAQHGLAEQHAANAMLRVKESQDAGAWLDAKAKDIQAFEDDRRWLNANEDAVAKANQDLATAKGLDADLPKAIQRLEAGRAALKEAETQAAAAPDFAALEATSKAQEAALTEAAAALEGARVALDEAKAIVTAARKAMPELQGLEDEEKQVIALGAPSRQARDGLAHARADQQGVVLLEAALDTQFQTLASTHKCPILDVQCPQSLEHLDGTRKQRHADLAARKADLGKSIVTFQDACQKEEAAEKRIVAFQARGTRLAELRKQRDEAQPVFAALPGLEAKHKACQQAHKSASDAWGATRIELGKKAGFDNLRRTIDGMRQRLGQDEQALNAQQKLRAELEAILPAHRALVEQERLVRGRQRAHADFYTEVGVRRASHAQLGKRNEEHASLAAKAATAKAAAEQAAKLASEAWSPQDKAQRDLAEKAHLTATGLKAACDQRVQTKKEALKAALDAVQADHVNQADLEKVKLDLKAAQRTSYTIETVRGMIKDLGPRVAARFVEQLSVAADEHFRALSGGRPVRLKWMEDYDVHITGTDGQTRVFADLSGGEQVITALAIRLALLKALSPVDFAIYDEPTTHLDAETRANVARVLQHSGQSQLLVVSHDDAFSSSIHQAIFLENDGVKTRIKSTLGGP